MSVMMLRQVRDYLAANLQRQNEHTGAWPMAASLLCAPVVFPWYLLWLLPFLMSASALLIIIWTVSIIPTYFQWHLRAIGRPWGALPGWVMLVEYGCVAIAAASISLRRVSRSAALQRSER